MQQPFTFSTVTAVRESWALFKKHIGFFIGISLITFILNFAGDIGDTPDVLSIILGIASFVWSIVWVNISLAAARGEETHLTFASIKDMMPTFWQVIMLVGVGLFTGLLILGGLVLLIIPGIYIMIRLSFATYAYLDKKAGSRKTARYTWDITKGKMWKTILVGLVACLLVIVGLVLFGLGMLITYPIAAILIAKYYYALVAHHEGTPQPIVAEATEIPTDLPQAETI